MSKESNVPHRINENKTNNIIIDVNQISISTLILLQTSNITWKAFYATMSLKMITIHETTTILSDFLTLYCIW